MLDGGFSPKLPTIITGRERFKAGAAAAWRTLLGLGTMATQNSNSVSITGGNAIGLTNVSATSVTATTGNITNANGTTALFTNGQFTVGYYSTGLAVGGTTAASTLDSQGTLGLKTVIVSAAGVLSGLYTNILVEPTGSTVCAGSPAISCSSYSTSITCTANSSHGGCTWNPQNCSDFDATDISTCESNSGCTWDMGNCGDFTDESSCTTYAGCSWDGILESCSGSYELGTCSGDYGNCTGTALCGGIFDETGCTAETGCSWVTGMTVTLPSLVDNRVYKLKNISAAGYDVIVGVSSGDTIEGAGSYTLADYNDSIEVVGKKIFANCFGFSEEDCTPSGCSWDGSDCGGFYVSSSNWYIMGNAGI